MADEETKEVEEAEAAEETSEGSEASEDSGEKAGQGSKLRKPILLLIMVVVQVAIAYSVAQFLILPRLPGDASAADSLELVSAWEAEAPERGSIIMMEDVVVNLRAKEGTRFLKVTTGLEFKEKELEQEIAERMPQLRDMLIDHLSSHEVEDVVHREGREVVKQQLLEDFNSKLQHGQLLNVYFSDFVVQ